MINADILPIMRNKGARLVRILGKSRRNLVLELKSTSDAYQRGVRVGTVPGVRTYHW